MRVCPKCGFVDDPLWRHKNWRLDVDYCRLDEFETLHPILAKGLRAGRPVVTDDHFAYRRCGRIAKLYVERVWRQLYDVGGTSAFRSFREKHYSMDPYQKKLFEV